MGMMRREKPDKSISYSISLSLNIKESHPKLPYALRGTLLSFIINILMVRKNLYFLSQENVSELLESFHNS